MTDQPARTSDSMPPEPGSGLHERLAVHPPGQRPALASEALVSGSDPVLRSEPATRRRPKLTEREPRGAYAFLDPNGGSAEPTTSVHPAHDPLAEMRECFLLEDYEGALVMADLILAMQPDNAAAREYQANCRAALQDVYAFRLAPLGRVPRLVRQPAAAEALSVDHRVGFVVSFIDGASTIDSIVDACGMPKSDALRILHDLVQLGVVAFE